MGWGRVSVSGVGVGVSEWAGGRVSVSGMRGGVCG